MAYYSLTLDLSAVETLAQFHEELKNTFGFPDFYGRNIHALIDCLSSLRYPEDGMSTFVLENKTDVALIIVKGLAKQKEIIINNFIIAIEQVNNRAINSGLLPSILLSITSN